MDWNSIGTQIILGVGGLVISALGGFITYLINKYVKDGTHKNMLLNLNDLIKNCVLEVQQVYVNTLKKEGKFDLASQKLALDQCVKKVKSSLTTDMVKWLEETYADPDSYLRSRIESMIGSLKFVK